MIHAKIIVDEIVSLGHLCQTKWFIEKHTLNAPDRFRFFDNIGTNKLRSILNLLKNDQDDLFDLENVVLDKQRAFHSGLPPAKSSVKDVVVDAKKERLWLHPSNSHWFYDVKYGIISRHDVPKNISLEEGLPQLQLKKKAQLCELLDLFKSTRNLLLIRVNEKNEPLKNTIELRDVLAEIRAEQPFSLWVFQENEMMKKNWGINNLSTFYDGPWEYTSTKDEVWNNPRAWLWDQLFSTIMISNKSRVTFEH